MVKKLIAMGVLFAAAGSVWANKLPTQVLESPSGFVIGVDAGYAYNTQMDVPNSSDAVYSNIGSKNTPWGWTVSGTIGYQFNSRWAVQFGYILNQSEYLKQTAVQQIKYNRYNMYLAAKIMQTLPWMNKLTGYAMVGPVYTKAVTTAGVFVGSLNKTAASSWSPMGAIGITYLFGRDFGLSLQYMYILQKSRSVQTLSYSTNIMKTSSNTQRVTIGVSYLFEM